MKKSYQQPLTQDNLIELDRKGFIPGPHESEETFLRRVEGCLAFKEQLEQGDSSLPFELDEEVPQEHLEKALDRLEKLYFTRPQWVPAFYSNKGLAPWHGGGAWIIELEHSLVTLFQLRRVFLNQRIYLGLYEREELLVHEYCHAVRMAYEEPLFEELFSYQSSSHAFRRRWGPLISSPKEVWLFISILFLASASPILGEVFPSLENFSILLNVAPLAFALYSIRRLWRLRRQLERCFSLLRNLLMHPEYAQACAFRLTDKEVQLFSRVREEEALAYIRKQEMTSLRWRVIHLRFPFRADK